VEAKVLGFLVFVGLGFGLSAAGATMLAGAEAPVWEHGGLFVFFIPSFYSWWCRWKLITGYLAFSIGTGHRRTGPHLWREYRHRGVVGYSRG
jgi:hypothetical protein